MKVNLRKVYAVKGLDGRLYAPRQQSDAEGWLHTPGVGGWLYGFVASITETIVSVPTLYV